MSLKKLNCVHNWYNRETCVETCNDASTRYEFQVCHKCGSARLASSPAHESVEFFKTKIT
jgi:hypothetical protein